MLPYQKSFASVLCILCQSKLKKKHLKNICIYNTWLQSFDGRPVVIFGGVKSFVCILNKLWINSI